MKYVSPKIKLMPGDNNCTIDFMHFNMHTVTEFNLENLFLLFGSVLPGPTFITFCERLHLTKEQIELFRINNQTAWNKYMINNQEIGWEG